MNERLWEAIVKGADADVVAALRDGADPRWADRYGKTALMVACHYGRPDIVAILLQHDADASQRDDRGRTALFYAAEQGHNAVVEALIQGAPTIVTMQDINGETAADIAAERGHVKIAERIRGAVARPALSK